MLARSNLALILNMSEIRSWNRVTLLKMSTSKASAKPPTFTSGALIAVANSLTPGRCSTRKKRPLIQGSYLTRNEQAKVSEKSAKAFF